MHLSTRHDDGNAERVMEGSAYSASLKPGFLHYFFKIGLYPSPINFVRIASASLMSPNGPTCTRNSLSVAPCAATNAGYCFFLSASTSASASSCLLTAATCTEYPPVGNVVVGSGAFAGVCAGLAFACAAVVSVFASAGVS